MCGILAQVSLYKPIDKDVFLKMRDTLEHRGPDDSGTYFSTDNKVALGHRRLSFLDLSPGGRQPMANNAGTARITFNGEIYNYAELKEELKGVYDFINGTDTEVLLAAYQQWGINFITRLKGMFAFALVDKDKLFIVRDHFGIKPLYYSLQQGSLIVASELKAIMASGLVEKEMDYSSVSDYFVYRYIPSPKTIWKNINKLPPACYAEICTTTLNIEIKEYWKLSSSDENTDRQGLIKKTGELIRQSVRQHIRADVPVGSFLSGGYDSSALVYYMTSLGEKPETFSIGFSEWNSSEHKFARIAADHLGVINHSVIADKNSLDLVERMPDVYDEPIADISIVPTFMVSELAHRYVKAVLSGEGADEIFGGYTWQHEFFNRSAPAGFWGKLKALVQPEDTVDFYAHAMAMGYFDRAELLQMLHPRLHPFIPDDVHWFYRQHYRERLSPLKSIQYLDIKCFMGELVLTKIDRASMANSLEVRVPFLDHQLFEMIFGVNEKCYFRKEQTKYLLQQNLKGHLPDEILNRKKQGFVGPDEYYMDMDWYKKELKESKLVQCHIIMQSYLDQLLKESYTWKLWKILVFEKWFAKWIGV